MGPIWPKGWQGVPENQNKYKKITTKTRIRKNFVLEILAEFLTNKEGLTAGRFMWYYVHRKSGRNRTCANLHRKKTFKNPLGPSRTVITLVSGKSDRAKTKTTPGEFLATV